MGQRHHGLHIGYPSRGHGSIIVVVDRFSNFGWSSSSLWVRSFTSPQVFTHRRWADREGERFIGAVLEALRDQQEPVRASHKAATLNSSYANDRRHGEKSTAFKFAKGWHEQADIARSYLDKAAKKMKKWADKKRRHTEYKVEDMVLVKLLPQQFKSLRPVHKGLVRRYEGPFLYLEGRQGVLQSGVTAKVKDSPCLPRGGTHHCRPNHQKRGVPPATEYLVKWKGLPESEASWEPQMHYGSSRSRLSGSGQKTRRGRLRLRWGRVSQDASNDPPHDLYRR
ncbi:hypothetical protein CK203_025212 [Vitis vinifera]|uniref:Chromo domain-containing protein n=1 Tax=Vitis vinifera TaxID=29760 RepID=A0A438JF45_VITVI|nr:hypothetical protein CK203_025212 [Vitis vinifera]